MIEVRISVTLKTFHGSFGATRQRHEFQFCAESARDARYLASSNVKSQGFPFDETLLEVEWTRRVYVPETSLLFGPVPKESVTVVKFESEPLKSSRDVAVEQVESEVSVDG